MGRVSDIDRGFNRICSQISSFDGNKVKVGWWETSGRYPKKDGGESVLHRAVKHEFGTRKIPSRPVLRIASDENRRKWEHLSAVGVRDVIDGHLRPRDVMRTLGETAVKDVQSIFGDKTKLKPLSPVTIAQKGHDAPLIETGRLGDAVSFRITKK